MVKEVIFIRHGQSYANSGTDVNMVDSPLTSLGREQARKIIEINNADLIICSPMRRALETFHYSPIKCSENTELIVSELFRELKSCQPNFKLLENQIVESNTVFLNRMIEAAKYIMSLTSNNVIIFCHGGVIKALTDVDTNNCQLVKADLQRINWISQRPKYID